MEGEASKFASAGIDTKNSLLTWAAVHQRYIQLIAIQTTMAIMNQAIADGQRTRSKCGTNAAALRLSAAQ
jgi:hypothetical protein